MCNVNTGALIDPIGAGLGMGVGGKIQGDEQELAKLKAGQGQATGAPAVSAPPQGQAAQAPDQASQRSAGGPGMSADSAGSTLLTGGKGIAPSLLTLGKNTLLGS